MELNRHEKTRYAMIVVFILTLYLIPSFLLVHGTRLRCRHFSTPPEGLPCSVFMLVFSAHIVFFIYLFFFVTLF
ncbi:hypothetical protein F4823DRAFT_241325 [Ustulina deusta]|nr:hypothetical protein F4823DRAFT_241325 [Ustulina deusta]